MKTFIVAATFIKMLQVEAENESDAYDVADKALCDTLRMHVPDLSFCNWHVKEVEEKCG